MKRIRYLHKDTLERKPKRHATYETTERKFTFMKANIFNSKRYLSLFLTLVMIVGMLPTTVFATTEESTCEHTNISDNICTDCNKYGFCGTSGNNCTWTITGDETSGYTLTISGSGSIEDYTSTAAPWYSYREQITNVIIESGVTHIGDNAFFNFRMLTSVIIPEGITSIGEEAFRSCSALTEVTIPSSMTSIGETAFCDCGALKSIAIPSGVTEIKATTFCECTSLVSVTIPDSVTTIGSSAFYKCTALTEITIPSGVTSIESDAFDECSSLTAFTVAEGNATYKSQDGVLMSEDGTQLFYPKGKSGAYTIPNTITIIDNEAFSGCTGLTEITIPESVTEIDKGAFNGCSSLTAINVAEGNENYASVDGVLYDIGMSSLIRVPEAKSGSLVIPDIVSSIDLMAGFDCNYLTAITLGENISSIPTDFWEFAVTNIYVAEGNDTYASQDGVLFSKDLTTLVRYPSGRSGAYIIPDGTETIAQVAFYDQQLLSELTIPDSVTTIENIAFAGNTALTTVNLSCFKSDLASNFDSSVLNYIHSWNYTANGATIISTCSDCDTQQTLTIVEPTLTTYGGAGNAKATITGTIDGVDTSAIEIKYTSGNTSFDVAPTNAGTYTASITIKNATASVSYTIEKADITNITAPTANTLACNGAEQPHVTAGTAIGGTIMYSLEENGTYAEIIPVGKNAGNYTVWYYIKGDENHNNSVKARVDVTIRKGDPDFSAPTAKPNLVYNGENQALVNDGTVTTGNGTMIYALGTAQAITGEFTTTIPTKENAGTYYVWYKVVGNANYEDTTSACITVTIDKKVIEIAWGNTTLTYDGTPKLPTATVKNLVAGDTCNITVEGEQTEAGSSYTATAASVDNSNYKLPANATTTFVIKNAPQNKPNVSGTGETVKGKADGKIVGLTTAMEISTDNVNYSAIIDADISKEYAAGTYYVRYAAKTNYDASEPTVVVIGAGETLKVTVPQNQVGYTLTTEHTELEWNGDTTITFTLADGYSKTNNFAVKVNRNPIELTDNQYAITDAQEDIAITVDGVADITAPEEVEMSVKGVGWKQFINKVTFGLFFKENVAVQVDASDLGSGIAKVEYLITENAFTNEDAVKADTSVWNTLTLENGVAKFNVTEKGKKYVYVRVTDNAGNIKVVSSDGGVVIYADSTKNTDSISYTKTTTDDVTAKVNLNGNSVKAIYNGTDLIDSNNYSVAVDGTITFKATYLDTLADGQYTLHIVYNPQGETYVESNINDAPAQTSIALTVVKQTGTVSITNDISKTYDGSAVTAPTYDRNNANGEVIVEYKVKGADDETYSIDAPKNAGDYTVRVKVKADDAGFYTQVLSAPVDFTIGKKALKVTAEDKNAAYGDAVPTYTVEYDGFVNGEDKTVLGGTLGFDCDYAQFSDKGEYTIKASGYTSGNYEITYVDGKLSVSPKAITVTVQNATSVYGDTIAELKADDNGGIVNGDTDVYKLSTTATSVSNVGKYEIKGIALDENYDITFANEADAYEIAKREVVVTVEAKNTIVNTALPTYTYTFSGFVGEDKFITEPTLSSNADITAVGEYDIAASGADAGSNYTIKYVSAKLTVLTDNAVDAAKDYEEELKDYDPDTVTSDDKAELEEMLGEIDTILDNDDITDNGKKALEDVKDKVTELLKEIDDADKATETENTEKVEDITSENVTPEDKGDLEKAKDDLEKALDEHGNNMTEDEKKAVQDEIDRIDEALEVIGNVEKVEELIDKLSDTITKDDADAIKAADDAYNALTDYEKSLVDKDTKEKLDDAKAALAELNKPTEPNSPATGDNSNMFLWIALLFISGGAVITLTVVDRKKRATKR